MTDTNKVLREEIRQLRAENVVFRRQLARYFTYPETRRLLRTGQLTPQPCEVCGASKARAHHDDYSKPEDIRWLCQKDHIARHKELGWGMSGGHLTERLESETFACPHCEKPIEVDAVLDALSTSDLARAMRERRKRQLTPEAAHEMGQKGAAKRWGKK